MSKVKYRQVVAIFEFLPIITINSDDSWRFRIEILKEPSSGKFFPMVYRWKIFTVKPTFPLDSISDVKELADHEILVKDFGFKEDELMYDSIEKALEGVIEEIEKIFSVGEDNEPNDNK